MTPTATPTAFAGPTHTPTATLTVTPTSGFEHLWLPLICRTMPEFHLDLRQQMGGTIHELEVAGDLVYAGIGPRLGVFSMDDPSAPLLIGQSDLLPEPISDIAVVGNNAYVSVGAAGLSVLDISASARPLEVATLATDGVATSVAVSGSYLFLTTHQAGSYPPEGSGRLYAIDIADPRNPAPRAFLALPNRPERVVVDGKYAYVADGDTSLHIIDISSPLALRQAGEYSLQNPDTEVRDIAAAGRYLYVLGAYLEIVDVIDPLHPKLSAWSSLPNSYGDSTSIAVRNGFVYATFKRYVSSMWETSTLAIVDATRPTDPKPIAVFDTTGQALDVATGEQVVFIADGVAGLRVVDVAAPAAPRQVGMYDSLASVAGIVTDGVYGYVAGGFSGFHILDLTDPAAPIRLGSLNPGDHS